MNGFATRQTMRARVRTQQPTDTPPTLKQTRPESILVETPVAALDPWTEIAGILRDILDPRAATIAPGAASAPQSGGTASAAQPIDVGSDADRKPADSEASEPIAIGPIRPSPGDKAFDMLAGKKEQPGIMPIAVPEFSSGQGKAIERPPEAGGGAIVTRTLLVAQRPAAEGGALAGSPKAIVSRWQGGVAGAAGAMPRPRVRVSEAGAADLAARREQSRARNTKAREGLVEDAKKNQPKAPVVENPPPIPPENPIPAETAAILGVSGRRLPDQLPPLFSKSPRVVDDKEPLDIAPAEPKADERPVPSDLFQILITPGADKIARIDPAAKDAKGNATPEAQQVQRALRQLAGKDEKKAPQERGEPILFKDLGPEPAPPLPAGLQIPVGQVVARLLASTDRTAVGVLDALREQAYPRSVLKTEFPDIGSGMLASLTGEVETELHQIAAAANVSEAQLKDMIDERRKELAASTVAAGKEADEKGKDAAEAVRDEGQKTADGVASAAKAAEEETLRRQEAAGGAADPMVINRRRDLIIGWVREQVTVQTTNYQLAGEKRSGELNRARAQMMPACAALVQRLVYRIMTPEPESGRKPRDPADKVREARLADDATVVRNWQDEEGKRIGEEVRKALKLADDTTKANRKAVEGAGDRALEAARRWATERILDGKGFWDRFVALIESWLSDADQLNEQWRVRRTRENRDAVASDIAAVEAARRRLASGLTQDEILADASLTDAQRLVIQQYFAQPAGTNPLDFAAARLKQTIASGHLDAVRPVLEQELIATPVAQGEYDKAEKLNRVAMAVGGGGFDAAKIAQDVHGAMDQIGTDEDLIFRSLKGLNSLRGAVVRKFYTARYGGSLDADLEDEMSGDELSRAQAQIDGKVALADAVALHDAVAGLGTDEAAIMSLLRNKTPEEVEAIRAEYLAKYGETLDGALKDDLSEGNEIDQANALLSGDTATADAIALDEAMRGGWTGLGTAEGDIEKVQTTVRDEVLARARSENWTAAQAEAEVRRRLKAIEDRFGERYKNVAQYNEPGLAGDSVLKRAFASELSGAELDLANALQDNDLTRADAARIEIERTGFYASDEKLVKVMRSQYERALEARRLDEGPARQMRVEREVARWRDQIPQLSEEEISRRRMQLDRQMEKELDAGAQKDSKIATEALRDAYEGKYNRNLAYTLAFNMSGTDAAIAQKLLKQGGKLTPLQEIDYATKGDGTDEEMLKKTFSSLTRAEIEDVARQWEARHPGRNFYAMLRSELSGRDESDIMDMAYHGAPESASERIEQEKRRVDREQKDLTGPIGRSVTGAEDAWMEHQLKKLEELDHDLKRTDWPPGPEGQAKRQELMEKVDFQVQRVQDAVEDHRRRIDSFTDAATQVVGIVVGVAVALILGAISGGTLGVATIAFISSLYATAATIATKALIKGGAYGIEEYGVDLAVGAVDALTAVATAGMGSKLLGPMKNLLARTRIGNVASAIGKSGIAQKALNAPVIGKGIGFAGKLLPSAATLERGAAKFMAESAENAIGAIPSTFTQMALTDTTWQGDPLMNFLEGGGMSVLQAVAMGHLMSGGMDLAGHAFSYGRGKLRMGSEVGRLLEASRLFSEGYGRFSESNPGASMGDFLAHPEGRKLRAELDAKGLMPTVESINRKIAADPDVKAATAFDPAHPDAPRKAAELHQARLAAAIPDSARQGAFVTPDPTLTGNSVRVEPLRIGDRIVGVEVKVGPDATPLDIAMHGATIDAMQKYRGAMGAVHQWLENAGARLTGSGLTVGSRGWEARLEMGKLPAIIDARIEMLAGTALTPEMRANVLADIESLDRQFHEHQAVFFDAVERAKEGRGYVAAEAADQKRPIRDRLAAIEADLMKTGALVDKEGKITDLGKLDLESRINAAQQLVKEARSRARYDDNDPRRGSQLREAQKILADAAKRYGIDQKMLVEHVMDGAHADQVEALLKLAPAAEKFGPEPMRKVDPSVAELDKLLKALDTPDEQGPMKLVEKIRAGGPDAAAAQAALNAQSTAPPDSIVVDFPTRDLEAAFQKAGGKPETGREGGKWVTVNGYSMFLYSPKPDPESGRLPPPKVAFEMDLPPRKGDRTMVYQFGDGQLRVWRGTPTSDHPAGVLRQESIISAGVDRAGHEEQLKTHGAGERTGAPTERAHLHGAGLGFESPFGIGPAPTEVNQMLQAKGIEKFMRDLRDALPPGATLSYQTSATFHSGSTRQARIEYKIDITVQGKRTTFAEFAIDIEADPPGTPPAMSRGSHSFVADRIARRYSDSSPAINSLFDGLWEAVNVPRVLAEGPAQARSANIAMRERMAQMRPEDVAAGVKASDGLVSHRPPDQAHFNGTAWADRLAKMIASPDTPEYIVVDLRKLGLTDQSRELIHRAIENVPVAKRYRVILLK